MLNLVSILVEVLFVLMITSHMVITNRSITRLEEKFQELDSEVFKQSKEQEVEVVTPARKKRIRKPKVAKEVV